MSEQISNQMLIDILKNKIQARKDTLSLNSISGIQIESRWGDHLFKLDLLIDICNDIGYQFHITYLKEKSGCFNKKNEALLKLHIRGCRMAQEILLLLSQGFVEGALARWRTLYEITVIATLISEADPSLANRWLAHEVVDRKKAMKRQQECADAMGFPATEFAGAKEINRDYHSALEQFGQEFEGDYGWVANQLGLGQRPNFSQLQRKAGQEHEAFSVKLAHLAVHVSPMASTALAHGIDIDPLLPGYRGEKLELAGANLAQVLVRLACLLIPKPWSNDSLLDVQIMLCLRDDIVEGLYKTADQIEDENQTYLADAVRDSERTQRYRYRKSRPKR